MSKTRYFIGILTIFIVGAVVLGCVKKPVTNVTPSNVEGSNVNQPVNQNPSAGSGQATTTAEIDTSTWKTYRNEKYGFEFKLPSNWEVISLDKNRFGLGDFAKRRDDDASRYGYKYSGDIILEVYENFGTLTIKDFYKTLDFNFFKQASSTESKFGDYNVYLFKDVPGIVATDVYILKINKSILEFTVFNSQEIIGSVIESIIQN